MQSLLHKIINSEYAHLYLTTLKISTLMKNENRWENPIKYFISFELGDEILAIEVSRVLEILKMKPFTPLPLGPRYFAGIINLRGKGLPVINTRLKLGMEEKEADNDSCIIVLQIPGDAGTMKLGAIVDKVTAVIEIPEQEIKPVTSLNSGFNPEYLKGIVEIENRMVMIMDTNMAFQDVDFTPSTNNLEQIGK
jgi:purine-binding chemotaxis protein CheW